MTTLLTDNIEKVVEVQRRTTLKGIVNSLVPRPIPVFLMLHAALKNWDGPGNEANSNNGGLW